MSIAAHPPAAVASRQVAKRGLIFGAAAATLALILLVSRRPDQWFSPQFWAEDGVEFFAAAETSGWRSCLQPYVGYFHTAPRAIAMVSTWLPWELAPAAYAWCAALVTALIVARMAFARLPLAPRLMGAWAMIGLPHSGEVFLNVTNLNWILGGLLVVNLLEGAPIRRSESWRRSAEVLFAGLSGVTSVFLAPFAALWFWRERRESSARLIMGAWIVAVVIQTLALSQGSRAPTTDFAAMLEALPWVLPRYAATVFTGQWFPFSTWLGVGVAAAVLVALAGLLLDRTNRHRGEAALMILAAIILVLAGRAGTDWWPHPLGAGARYTYVPLVLTLYAFAWLWAGTQRPVHRAIALALYLCPLIGAFSAWRANPLPEFGWGRQVREVIAGTRTRFEVPPNHSFPVPQRGGSRADPPFTPIR